MESFLKRMFRDTFPDLQTETNPQMKLFGVQETCMELCGTLEVWIELSCKSFFLKMKGLNFLPKEQVARIWAI